MLSLSLSHFLNPTIHNLLTPLLFSLPFYLRSHALAAVAATGFLPGGLVVVMGFRMMGDPAGFLAATPMAGWDFGVAITAGLEAVLLSVDDGARGILYDFGFKF
uniref:(northern house mosquito) hypothetical protein n=1 Tax=Culex pipiens TaxID=7175 RepID=A0A8D8BWM7_CULPI